MPTQQVVQDVGEGRRLLPSARTKKRAKRSRLFREFLVDLLYAGPQYALYIGLLVVPFVVALPIVFTDQIDFLDRDIDVVGMRNIVSLFQEPMRDIFFATLRRTALFTLVNYIMVFAFGFLLALAMYELSSKFKGAFFTIIYMPWMVSGVGIGLLMIMLFTRDTGTANLAIQALGLGKNTFDVRGEAASVFGLPVIYGWKTAGFNMALFLGGLLSIPRETIESAKMDGANYVKRVAYVYIPQMRPSIIIATIFALIGGFGIFDELVGLGGLAGNTDARFLSILIYELGFATSQNFGAKTGTLAQGIAVSLVVFLPLVSVAFYLNKLQKKMQYH